MLLSYAIKLLDPPTNVAHTWTIWFNTSKTIIRKETTTFASYLKYNPHTPHNYQ
jgi:hypothetical protein